MGEKALAGSAAGISRRDYGSLRLGAKLRRIREALGLNQTEFLRRYVTRGFPNTTQPQLSLWEQNRREPPLRILLLYADIANVYLEVLVRDELDLPDKIPAAEKTPI